MIKFESITYKNILSVGQAPLTLNLSACRLTALNGPSGSGKSLFLDALSFALFGRAFRDINKADLINTINGKGLSVEVVFSIGASSYKIVRGLKPNVFEIYLNGDALNQESHAKDQQKYLEDQILKMNWKMFTHVVMLGAANYTPFMRLKPQERKKMVENILGIDVFSTMNALLKTKISDETLRYKAALDRRELLSNQVEYLVQQQRTFEEKVKEEIKGLTQKLIVVRDRKKAIDLSLSNLQSDLETTVSGFNPQSDIQEFTETFEDVFNESFDETFNETFTEVDSSEFDPSELSSKKATHIAEIKALREKLEHVIGHAKFYSQHETCPTCSQSIGLEFREVSQQDLARKKLDIEADIQSAEAQIDAIREEAEKLHTRKRLYIESLTSYRAKKEEFERRKITFEARRRHFEDKRRQFEDRRRAHEEQVKKIEVIIEQKRQEFERLVNQKRQSIVEMQSQSAALVCEAKLIFEAIENKKNHPLLDNSDEIKRLEGELEALSKEIDGCARNVRLFRDAQSVIKDDGVKSELLKRYIPTLNKYINKYLNKMGMFVSFELDQEFNDTIRSRHRDVLSYANYSEGERQRLDLAVLLAWRHLAQAQSAVNTNLLVLDEVLDSYLDQSTTETILNLLRGEDFQAFNIVVISHKEGLSESFDRTLHFQKKNNFTSVAS